MLATGIKSKPVYTPLAPDLTGRHHFMVGHSAGKEPLLRVVRDLHAAAPETGARTQVLFITEVDSRAAVMQEFHNAGAAAVQMFESSEKLLEGLSGVLTRSYMGTRLYVAGPESFMGLVMRSARQFNLNKDEVRAEECGCSARRVYCIHCQAAMENVMTNIVQCKDCNRWLLVRDHYSSRLAAYMGVMVDAEAPGVRPEQKEVFR